jgi:hypothetical protein
MDHSVWSDQCKEEHIHQDLGLFGYYPIIDRKNQIYMQVGQQYLEGLNSTGLGCEYALILRILVSPLVYKALGKPAPPMPTPPPTTASNLQVFPSMPSRPRVPQWPASRNGVWADYQDALDSSV